jgi:hypothetical protein
MPYSVIHRYGFDKDKATGRYRKTGTVLLCLKDTLPEAEAMVLAAYAGRFMAGRDLVQIYNEQGISIKEWEVDFMPQFEAMPGMVKHYPSSSGSGTYTAQINTTGVVSCNCMAWTRGFKKMSHPGSTTPYRHCKHTDALTNQLGVETEIKGQYIFRIDPKIAKAKQKFSVPAAKATGPQEKFMLLIKDYEDAIGIMAALEPSEMYQAAAAVEMTKFKVESYLILLEQHGIDMTPQFKAAEAKLEALRA